jgi:4-hydroxybenzoate polyprenyltransferase
VAGLLALVRATHPLPAAAVTVLATAVVVARGAAPGRAAVAFGSILAGQLSVGWSNDYLDRHEDRAAGRRDKPLAVGAIGPRTVLVAAAAALVVCVALALPLGAAATGVMAVAVGAAWAYNLGLQRTALSWVPYAVSFGLAPVFVWLVRDEVPPAWVVAAAALLGLAGHLTNVLPDLDTDRRRGARGLPHRLGAGWSVAAACLSLAAALALLVAGGGVRTGWPLIAAALSAGLILAVAVAGGGGGGGAAFVLTMGAAGAAVAAFLLAATR